jgi:hypothetical protein
VARRGEALQRGEQLKPSTFQAVAQMAFVRSE